MLLAGRATRRSFWAMSAILLVGKVVLLFWTTNQVLIDAVFFLPWLWIAWRRCHDFNLSGWWSLVPFLASVAEGFARGVTSAGRGAETSVAAPSPLSQVDWSLFLIYPLDFASGFVSGFTNSVITQLQQNPLSFFAGWLAVLILAFYPGNRGANRFGESPRKAS